MGEYPFISLILVVRNGVDHVRRAIDCLVAQEYPVDRFELIIVDGFSTDGTREWIQEYIEANRESRTHITVLNNPQCILASGWNLAIQSAKGEFVCRIDVHSVVDKRWVKMAVQTLLNQDKKLAAVGGWLEHSGAGVFGESVAKLFSSSFGVGNSPFRRKPEKMFSSDTAVFAVYRREIFNREGYFDESLARNQDIDFHKRLVSKGYRFLTSPDMKARYFVRSTFRKLVKKAIGDGRWVLLSNSYYLRHLIPLFFLLYVVIFIILIPLVSEVFGDSGLLVLAIPLLGYVMLDFYYSFKNASKHSFLLFLLHPVYHLSYGWGSFWAGIKLLTKKSTA